MDYIWFKLHIKGWLAGSIRHQLTPAERGVWVDLLALAAESKVTGVICITKGVPIPRKYLASRLRVPLKILNSTIEKGLRDKNAEDDRCRIMEDESGCLVIGNWDKYQGIPLNKQHETPQERELREKMMLSKLQRRYPDFVAEEIKKGYYVDNRTGETWPMFPCKVAAQSISEKS